MSNNFQDGENTPNPFAPPETLELRREDHTATVGRGKQQPKSWWYILAIWCLVCGTSALPSFMWGMGTLASEQIPAMCAGILFFVVLYTLTDLTSQSKPWRHNPATRLTLRIGYATRMIISVVFPIGGAVDLAFGLFSVNLAGRVAPQWVDADISNSASFAGVLLITIIQGTVLNLALGAFMLLVFVSIVLIGKLNTR